MHAFLCTLCFFCCSVSCLMVLDKGFCLIRQWKTCMLFCFSLIVECVMKWVWILWRLFIISVNISVGEQPLGQATRSACVRLVALSRGLVPLSRGLVQGGPFLSFAYFLLLCLLSSIGMMPSLLLSTRLVSSRESVSPDWHVKRFLNKQH